MSVKPILLLLICYLPWWICFGRRKTFSFELNLSSRQVKINSPSQLSEKRYNHYFKAYSTEFSERNRDELHESDELRDAWRPDPRRLRRTLRPPQTDRPQDRPHARNVTQDGHVRFHGEKLFHFVPSWNENEMTTLKLFLSGGSPGIVVMGVDSRPRGREFESLQHQIDHFSHLSVVKLY